MKSYVVTLDYEIGESSFRHYGWVSSESASSAVQEVISNLRVDRENAVFIELVEVKQL